MGSFGWGCLGDLLISGVRANLDLRGPGDLAEPADVDGAKECFIGKRCEHAAPDIRGEVNFAFHAVGIREARAKSRQRLDFDWSFHLEMTDGRCIRFSVLQPRGRTGRR